MSSEYDFVIESGLLTAYRGVYAEVTIPDGVTAIGDGAFKGNPAIQTVKIPEGVREIGKSAFEGCKALSYVTLPPSVEVIGESAFFGCSSIRLLYPLPKNLRKIGAFAFSTCSTLWRITIPEGTEEIGAGAFMGNVSMESATLPVSLKVLGPHVFDGCPVFRVILYRGTKKEWKEFDLTENRPLKKASKVYKYRA